MWLVSNLYQHRNNPINVFYLRAAIVPEADWKSGLEA